MTQPTHDDEGARGAPVRTVPVPLCLSTGVVTRVRSRALIGRRPMPEPTEAIDELIVLADPGRTVSKTHVEIGLEQGRLWLSDRFSANGTTIVSADGSRTVCRPGRRYPVNESDRIEVGEQYFDIG